MHRHELRLAALLVLILTASCAQPARETIVAPSSPVASETEGLTVTEIAVESNPDDAESVPPTQADQDGDGIPDSEDVDVNNDGIEEGIPIPEGYGNPVIAHSLGPDSYIVIMDNGTPFGPMTSGTVGERPLFDKRAGQDFLDQILARIAKYGLDVASYRAARDAGQLPMLTFNRVAQITGPVTLDTSKAIIVYEPRPEGVPGGVEQGVVWGVNNDQTILQTGGWIHGIYYENGDLNRPAYYTRIEIGSDGVSVLHIGFSGLVDNGEGTIDVILSELASDALLKLALIVEADGHVPNSFISVSVIADNDLGLEDNGLPVNFDWTRLGYLEPRKREFRIIAFDLHARPDWRVPGSSGGDSSD